MGLVTVSAEEFATVPPEVVFDRFGRGSGAGWLFDAACDRLAVGAVVTIRVPLAGGPVDILGRISALRRPASITISHAQPWQGRIRLRFVPTAAGTRIRLHADIDESGLEWLMRRQGLPVRPSSALGPRIGLLISKSGPGSLFAAAGENAASLALEEINADGGVDGRPVELLIADDATDPATGVLETNRLIHAGCRTVFLMTTSATYTAVASAVTGGDALLVQTLMNEGGGESRLRIRLGERPAVQLAAAALPMMKAAGGRRWFLAGNDYIWPRSLNSMARAVLPGFGATLVGEQYAALGTEDFGPIIEAVAASGADIVLNTFVGADAAAFERQCHAMGLREQALTLAPAMDESTLERIGAAAAPGIHGISGYFQHLENDGNHSLVQRYRTSFGPWAPPLSSFTESVFEAIHMWASATRRARTTDPHAVADEMRVGRFNFPRGIVTLDGTDQVHQRLFLAEARGATFRPMHPAGVAG